jgi:hypothetical protein
MTTPIFYANARDDLNASAANKERLALNHFNFFLKTYCVQIGINIAEAAVIPYHGIPCQANQQSHL